MATHPFVHSRPDIPMDVDPAKVASHMTRILQHRDFSVISQIREKYREDPSQSGRIKYLDYKRHLAVNVRRCLAAGLDNEPPRKVLDIGTGVGYFPFVAKELGHTCMTLDCRTAGVYADVVQFLDVPQIEWSIEAMVKLPERLETYDLITAFAVAFCQAPDTRKLWGAAEWGFFLEDVTTRCLRPGGTLWMHLNALYDGNRYDSAIERVFKSFNARITGAHVVISRAIQLE